MEQVSEVGQGEECIVVCQDKLVTSEVKSRREYQGVFELRILAEMCNDGHYLIVSMSGLRLL